MSRLGTLLGITRPLIVFDTETTGVGPEDRVIELGFQVHKPGVDAVVEWRSYVHPGIPIPPAATEVHGITDAMLAFGCRRCGREAGLHPAADCATWEKTPPFSAMAPALAKGFGGADLAGKNVRFDIEKLAHEFLLAGVPWDWSGAAVIDLERLEQIGEPRDLSSLYKRRTGREPVGAHGALSDVRMTTEILEVDLELFAAQLPWGLRELHELQWPGFIDAAGRFRFDKDGVPYCAFGTKYRGRKMSEIPASFYSWIMGQSFPDDVKKIAEQAIARRYPRQAIATAADAGQPF